MQRSFSKSLIFSSLVVAAPIMALEAWSMGQPDRPILPDAMVAGRASAVAIAGGWPALIAAAKMWRLAAPDPRFGGLSGLAIDGAELVALTDSGAVIRFAPPVRPNQRIAFRLHDLPAGPGSERHKKWRDSESLLRDPRGRGWWVGFENRHSLWLFDPRFSRAIYSAALPVHWSRNRGAEALIVGPRDEIFTLPESGGRAVATDARLRGQVVAPRATSDATRLADGRLVLLVRPFGWRGFESEVRISAGRGKPSLRLRLQLGPLVNPEGIAAAPLAGGGTRLWIVTDDNFRPWMRTLLLALDLPPGA